MSTQEIPQQEWLEFFNEFSRRHEGWIVALEDSGPDMGALEEAVLPLVGIAADLKDGGNAILIMLGGRTDREKDRIISRPTHVWFRQEQDETLDALEIESEEGFKTLLQFRAVHAGDTAHQLHQRA